jgi:O-phospho-L-seryl-tRNASec:L-selenocysteinyl-tRNA synthase
VGYTNLHTYSSLLQSLLSQRCIPLRGFTVLQITYLLTELSLLDTNNSPSNLGVGEREGRIYSSLLATRPCAHGIGRSGDILEPQPKSVGTSILIQIAYICLQSLMKKVVGLSFVTSTSNIIILPVATGKSMEHCLLYLKRSAPETAPIQTDVVLWCRIDQKSCLKSIISAGLTPVVVPTIRTGDVVTTDVNALVDLIKQYAGSGTHRVTAIISTTSCFAPRSHDPVDSIAKLAQEHNIPHVINNAYGLQCPAITKQINRAVAVGRVDYIVSSLDKNFLVPVGGAVVYSPNADQVAQLGKSYPGRASAGPIHDLFVTLLEMGEEGYTNLLRTRLSMITPFRDALQKLAEDHGERMLETAEGNTISHGITLNTFKNPTMVGSMLFSRQVSGARTVKPGESKTIGNVTLESFGSSCDDYDDAYLTAAVAVGMDVKEGEEFIRRLDKTLKELRKKESKDAAKKAAK